MRTYKIKYQHRSQCVFGSSRKSAIYKLTGLSERGSKSLDAKFSCKVLEESYVN